MTDADKRIATELVYANLRVRLCCRRDPERVGKIAEVVWKYLDDTKARRERKNLAMPGRTLLIEDSVRLLEMQPDYDDLVCFIPMWLIWFVLKIIISILIDYWFLKPPTPTPTLEAL